MYRILTVYLVAFSLIFVSAEPVFGYVYTAKTLQVPVDHFSFSRNDSFNMKYLVNDSFWDKQSGPIFLYTGNEGAIEMFADNSGFMWDIAPDFKALLVFAEHRYYGSSLPFGEKSLANPESAGYLTSQQALADYADLIEHIRSNQSKKSPVIAFGGSYGGMLAAYIRMKYPHLVAGAIASSAPIWQFPGLTPCEAFYVIATSSYECKDLVRNSWGALRNVTSQDAGLTWLSAEWKLCKKLKTEETSKFIDWLEDLYIDLAMVNYPYPTNFLADLPAYPVHAFCQKLQNKNATGKDLLKELFQGISIYFNYTGQAKCLDWNSKTSSVGEEAWNYQSCTEMVMPMCPNGIKDMFEKSPWDFKKYSDDCYAKWKVRPEPYLAEKIYGGKRIESASNIVFSNGLLDPWASGGVLRSFSDSLVSILIPDGAHHLDLRGKNEADPGSVREARLLQTKHIHKWIAEYHGESTMKSKPRRNGAIIISDF